MGSLHLVRPAQLRARLGGRRRRVQSLQRHVFHVTP